MFPTGGISMLIHLVINGLFFVGKHVKRFLAIDTSGIDFKHIFNRKIVAVISLILLPGTIAYNAG